MLWTSTHLILHITDHKIVPCSFINVIGRWTRPGTTLVYVEEKLSKWPWSMSSPKGLSPCLHYPLSSSNEFSGEKGIRGSLSLQKLGGHGKEMLFNICFCFSIHNYSNRGGYCIKKQGYRCEQPLFYTGVLLSNFFFTCYHYVNFYFRLIKKGVVLLIILNYLLFHTLYIVS